MRHYWKAGGWNIHVSIQIIFTVKQLDKKKKSRVLQMLPSTPSP